MEQTSDTPTLTQAQAVRVVIDGVKRTNRSANTAAIEYVRDAIKLREHNVRKLAVLAEAEGKLSVGFDSYLSYMSNAAGVAGMFEWDLAKYEEWLEANPEIVGLSASYKHLREAFGPERKPSKPKADKAEGSEGSTESSPLEVILSLIPHLSDEEKLQVLLALEGASAPEADLAEAA